jgi:hypothetical protein
MVQTSPAKVKVTSINQVALVVKDLQKVMENYWNILGIGPWDVYSWEAPLVCDRKYHGGPAWAREKIAIEGLRQLVQSSRLNVRLKVLSIVHVGPPYCTGRQNSYLFL